MIRNRALARLGALPRVAPSLALPGPVCHVRAGLGKGDVVPARGLVGRVPGLESHSLAPRPVRSLVDKCTLARARHAPPLPPCGPGRGLWTATRAVGFACTLRVIVRSLGESTRALRAAAGSAVIVRDHAVPATGRVEALGSSQDHGNSGLWVELAPAVQGSSIPQPKPSLQDLARLFLSLSGSHEQWDAVAGSAFSAATGSGAGSLPGPAAPVPVAAPSMCSSASVPAPVEGSPAGVASATGSLGRGERSRESSHSERHHRRSSSGERSQSGKKRRWGQSPSPARSSCLAHSSASSSSASSGAGVQEGVMPSPPRWSSWCGWWSL